MRTEEELWDAVKQILVETKTSFVTRFEQRKNKNIVTEAVHVIDIPIVIQKLKARFSIKLK